MANFFPRWSNLLPLQIAVCLGTAVGGIALAFAYYATPKAQVVGYQPAQPIPFSHKIHVDQLGLDCRYCHSFAEVAGHSNVPSGNTCWNCHQHVQRDSPKLAPLHKSMDVSYPGYDGKPIEWVRVHKAPDYVYFNHSAHLARGISCQSCHGNVDQMEVVYQAESHSMGWCLDCHNAPEKHLRPLEEVYNFKYDAEKYLAANPTYQGDKRLKTQEEFGLLIKDMFHVHPKTSCSTCHH